MDPVEASRLTLKYAGHDNITVYPTALYSSDAELTFNVSTHKALNSVFEANAKLLKDQDYMVAEFTQGDQKAVQARALDSILANKEIHFLKLDVEGAEYEVLLGATKALESTALGVRSEVLFAPIFNGAKLFGHLHDLLASRGFELLNLDYNGAGNKTGRFTLPTKYGKLLSSDAVWVISQDRLWSAEGPALHKNLIRYALFLLFNGASDLAVDALIHGTRERGLNLSAFSKDKITQVLRQKMLELFKSLMSVPQLRQEEIKEAYLELFSEEFPVMNKYYER